MQFAHVAFHNWVVRVIAVLRRVFGEKTYLVGAIAVPLVVFAQLANQKGLYELGDANFPLRPFPLDYFLPWQERVAAGVDNVFIGVPRLAYYASINFALLLFRNAQVAQWIWYAGVGTLGVIGAYLLARRFGASAFSFPLALFYAFNLWSYDRLAQPPLFLAYEAAPLAIYLLLRSLERQRVVDYLAFALSVILIVPALQIAYLVFVLCAAIVAYWAIRQRIRPTAILTLLAIVFVVNGFFLIPMGADFIGRDSNAVGLVAARFPKGVFSGYAVHATVLNAMRLASFFYSSLGRQPLVFQWITFLAPILVLLAANALPNWRRPVFVASVCLIVVGLWLVTGVNIAPGAFESFRHLVPGLKLFVEPDYFTPLVVLGMFGALAGASAIAYRAYRRWWSAAIWLLGCAGILPFLPFFGSDSGLPQTLIPATYVRFQQTPVAGRTLWLPNLWVARYRWSPYVINGFTVLNSPSDAIGPQMLEWTPPDTLARINRLVADVETHRIEEASLLMRSFNISDVAIAADQLSPDGATANLLVKKAEASVRSLRRRGAITSLRHLTEPFAELVAAQTSSRLPTVGLSQTNSALPQHCNGNIRDFRRLSSVAYDVDATVHGRCSLVFRDSFAPAWRVAITAGDARIDNHFEAEGYANGWSITSDGPISFRIYHALGIPYAVGIAMTILGLLAFLGLSAREKAAHKSPT